MKMTVVVTTFNRDEALHKVLVSLMVQSRLPDEMIVSDDGSSQDIRGLLEAYAKAVDFSLVFVRQEDRGFRLARCRNNAIRAATGDYLVFLDQDAVVTPGYLDLCSLNAQLREFLVAYPVLLDEAQSQALTPDVIERGDYGGIVTAEQLAGIRRQFRKDRFYEFLRRISRRGNRPKLRGGAFGIHKSEVILVNGFDENYVGWGTEDDDLGRRLYRAGITGHTVFKRDFPLHLWHPHATGELDSVNLAYYNRRRLEIARGDYRAVNGISNPLGDDIPTVVRINP